MTVHDKPGNFKTSRRIILFDDSSVVDKKGDEPKVVQANEYFWITKYSDRIDIRWPGRYMNLHHHTQGWLNAVKDNAEIFRELDDHEQISRRGVNELHNIEGLVYFLNGLPLTKNISVHVFNIVVCNTNLSPFYVCKYTVFTY